MGWDGDEEDEEEEAMEQHGSLTAWDVEVVVGEQKTSSANPFCFAN